MRLKRYEAAVGRPVEARRGLTDGDGTRFTNLKDLTEKILRLFSIIVKPGDHLDYSVASRLRYVMSHSMSVSVRDLVR